MLAPLVLTLNLVNESPLHKAQVLFKLLLLCWDSEQVSLWKSPLRAEFQFLTDTLLSWASAFQSSQMLYAIIISEQVLWAGVTDEGLKSLRS